MKSYSPSLVDYGVYGDLNIVCPKPYAIYLRMTMNPKPWPPHPKTNLILKPYSVCFERLQVIIVLTISSHDEMTRDTKNTTIMKNATTVIGHHIPHNDINIPISRCLRCQVCSWRRRVGRATARSWISAAI